MTACYYKGMSFFDAVILGIVEGITEFLPISSTAHLILTSKIMGIQNSEFLKTFEIVIQLGAILAVMVLYWRRVVLDKKAWMKIGAAFLPTAVVGFLLYGLIKNYFFENLSVILWALAIGGVLMIVFELQHRERPEAADNFSAISYKQAVGIGLFQSLAVVPGVSRAAATIIGGLLLGLNRKTIVEFSFLLAVPTMLAATSLDLLKGGADIVGAQWISLSLGFVVAFFVAILAIKWLLKFLQSHSFVGFGVYRIILAILFLFLLI